MSDSYQITIGSYQYDVEELADHIDDGTLYDYLKEDLKEVSDKETFLDQAREACTALLSDIENKADEIDDEIDELDPEASAGEISRLERDIEELDELMEVIDHQLYESIETCVTKISDTYLRGTDDFSINLENVDDVVYVTPTGGSATVFEEDGVNGEMQDYDGDGLVTYQDELLRQTQEAAARPENGQDIYITCPNGYVMTSDSGTINGDGTLIFKFVNADGLTKEVQIENFSGSEGINITFSFGNASAVPENIYNNWRDEVQQRVFLNENMFSVYDNLNEVPEEDQLSYIENFDEIRASAAEVCEQYAVNNSAAELQSYVEDGLDKMFAYLNDASAMGTPQECMGEFIQSISSLPAAQQEEIMVALVMTMFKKAGQGYFQALMSGVVTLIENVFVQDDILSTNGKIACLALEMLSGGAGMFGGAGILGTNLGQENRDGTVVNIGGIFESDAITGVYAYHDEYWATDDASTITALEQFQLLIPEVSWASDNGEIDQCLLKIDEMHEAEDHVDESSIYMQGLAAAIEQLDTGVFKDSAADGIDADEGYIETLGALEILQEIETLSLEDVAKNFKAYIQDLPDKHDGDVLAAVLYFIYKGDNSCSFLKALFDASPGLEGWIKATVIEETITPYYAGIDRSYAYQQALGWME